MAIESKYLAYGSSLIGGGAGESDPIEITWENYILLTDAERAGNKYLISGVPDSNVVASGCLYDNESSGLTATNVQDAIDEIAEGTETEFDPSSDNPVSNWALCTSVFGNVNDIEEIGEASQKTYTPGDIIAFNDGTSRVCKDLISRGDTIDDSQVTSPINSVCYFPYKVKATIEPLSEPKSRFYLPLNIPSDCDVTVLLDNYEDIATYGSAEAVLASGYVWIGFAEPIQPESAIPISVIVTRYACIDDDLVFQPVS